VERVESPSTYCFAFDSLDLVAHLGVPRPRINRIAFADDRRRSSEFP
jgi:hypothetical protein